MTDGELIPRAELTLDGDMLTVRCWESDLPETPQPWFQIVCGDNVLEGQAVDPPEALPDGRVLYRAKMGPAQPAGGHGVEDAE